MKLQALSRNPHTGRAFTPSKIYEIQKQIQNSKLIKGKGKRHCVYILGVRITAFTGTFTSTFGTAKTRLFNRQIKYLEIATPLYNNCKGSFFSAIPFRVNSISRRSCCFTETIFLPCNHVQTA